MRILHLEDCELDRELVDLTLEHQGIERTSYWAKTGEEFAALLNDKQVDLILCDGTGPGFEGTQALTLARQLQPAAAFVYVTGHTAGPVLEALAQSGADGVVSKAKLKELAEVLPRAFERKGRRFDEMR